jgi:hypothetical protein
MDAAWGHRQGLPQQDQCRSTWPGAPSAASTIRNPTAYGWQAPPWMRYGATDREGAQQNRYATATAGHNQQLHAAPQRHAARPHGCSVNRREATTTRPVHATAASGHQRRRGWQTLPHGSAQRAHNNGTVVPQEARSSKRPVHASLVFHLNLYFTMYVRTRQTLKSMYEILIRNRFHAPGLASR